MGIGFLLVVKREDAERVEAALRDARHGVHRVGEIVAGTSEVRLL